MLIESRKAQLGLNLVELMIGLVVGMIVLAAMTSVYLSTARGSKDTLNANRLNQDMRAVMDIMVADIRRSGYWGTAAIATPNPFTVRGGGSATDIYIPSADCVLYSYDATFNGGTVGTADSGTDFFGFKRTVVGGSGVVWSATNFGNTNQANCTGNLGWQQLTDPKVINFSALTFSETGSQCLDATTSANWTFAAGDTAPPCADAGAANYAAASGDTLAETRQITITMTATHVNDSTLTRTLTETVLVRNNRILTAP